MPTHEPALTLLLFPPLAWGCLRSSARDALVKMLVLEFLASTLTSYGRGPLARPDLTFAVPADTQTILLATFVMVSAAQVLVLCIAVGDRAEGARTVAAERDRIRGIVQSISTVAIIGTDRSGLITLFNPGAERLLGYAADEVLGQSTRLLHSQAAVAAKAAELGVAADFVTVAGCLLDQGPTEMGFLRSDGQERCHLMSLHRVLDDRGALTGHVSTSEDITERIEAHGRLEAALQVERTASEKLRELDRIKDAFVSSVSHELRTPLTNIVGYVELLQGGDCGALPPDQARSVERIRTNCARLLTLISDLLDLGRLQEGAPSQHTVVDLVEAVRTGVAVSTPAASSRGVEVTQWLPDRPQPVIGEREQLERVVINLVGNAIKFTEPGGGIDVRVSAEAGELVLEVSDTGVGVPLAEQPRLFDRFFRSSVAQQLAVPGSGLGLSITRAIVEQHGGRITFTSSPGVGTTFRVHLPSAVLAPAGTPTSAGSAGAGAGAAARL